LDFIFNFVSISQCLLLFSKCNRLFKYDATTSIESINEQESEFPTISFCMKHDNIFEIEIKDIWFNNQNLIEEWQNHIESYQDLVYGQCYRFNSG